MVSHETVRFSNLSQTPTSRPRPRCKNQGNPTPGDVVKRAPNKVHQFQMNKKKYSGAVSASSWVPIVFIAFLAAPTLGMNALHEWLDRTIKLEVFAGRGSRWVTPKPREFKEYIDGNEDAKLAVMTMIEVWMTAVVEKRRLHASITEVLAQGVKHAAKNYNINGIVRWAGTTLANYYQKHGTWRRMGGPRESTPIKKTLSEAAHARATAGSMDAVPCLEEVATSCSESNSPGSSRATSRSTSPRGQAKPTEYYVLLPKDFTLDGSRIRNGDNTIMKTFMDHRHGGYGIDLISQGTTKYGTYEDYIKKRIIERDSVEHKNLLLRGYTVSRSNSNRLVKK